MTTVAAPRETPPPAAPAVVEPPPPPPGLALDPLQQQAATAPEGPIIIMGGPGTGKTRTLVSRVKHLLDNGVTPFNITLLTYTARTAEQAREQLAQVTHEQNVFVGTLHQYSSYFLRQGGAAALGRSGHYTIWDQIQASETLQDLIQNLKEELDPEEQEVSAESGMTPADIADLLQWRSMNLSLLPADAKPPREARWLRLSELYEAEKLKQNTLDIDDLTPMAITAMEQDPGLRETWSRIRTRHLLIDEFQDLTPRQYHLVKLLTGPSKSITIATDPNQSIYGWRGADIELFKQFHYDHTKAEIYLLRINHRSAKNLADATVALSDHPDMTGLQYTVQDSIRMPGAKPRVATVEGSARQADQFVIAEIQEAKRQGVDWAEMALVYRRNAASRRLASRLQNNRIPYHILGDTRRPEDSDAYALRSILSFLLNPQDATALANAALYYKGDKIQRLHRGALKSLKTAAARENLDFLEAARICLETVRRRSPAEQALSFLLEACPRLQGNLDDPELTLHDLCVEGQHLLHRHKRTAGPLPRPEPEMVKLLILSESMAPRPQEDKRQQLSRFLELLNAAPYPDHRASENEDPTEPQTSLTLSSIHAAKGIQWRYVWIIDANDHILPGNIPVNHPQYQSRLEEEQRIFYVASSRAADQMTFVCPTKGDRDVAGEPSRFIEALGSVEHLLIAERDEEDPEDPDEDE